MQASTPAPVGQLLRHWRQRRRLSQLDLALDAEVSTRHLSCLETGRAAPSREMVLRLAERLDVPLRARNQLLTAAGYAPMFGEHALSDPLLAAAHEAVQTVLRAHEPYPALALDRHWNLLAHNRSVPPLLEGVADPALLAPPLNVLRLSLHPQGLAPRIANLASWRAHLLERLRHQIRVSGDAEIVALHDELRALPAPHEPARPPERRMAQRAARSCSSERAEPPHPVAVPLQLERSDGSIWSFISTVTVFGTPLDITLAELALETFFPADAATAAALRAAAVAGDPR